MPAPVREPIYQRLCQHLRDLLRTDTYPPGSQFLTERQVAERHGVSRITANKALAALAAEGLLDFRKGVGTFVATPTLAYDLRGLVSFTDKARAAGRAPSTTVLALTCQTPGELPDPIRNALHDPGPCWHLVRLRLADGIPMILERRWVPVVHCPRLTAVDAAGSLYAYFSEHCGHVIGGAEQAIHAVNLDADDAGHLGVEPGAAALELACTARLADGIPLWSERTRYRGDRYAFTGSFGVGPAQPVSARLQD